VMIGQCRALHLLGEVDEEGGLADEGGLG
jgi:hypothetical protein